MDDLNSIVERVSAFQQIRDETYYDKATKVPVRSLAPGTHFLHKQKTPWQGMPREYIFVGPLDERVVQIQRLGDPTLWNLNANALIVPMKGEQDEAQKS